MTEYSNSDSYHCRATRRNVDATEGPWTHFSGDPVDVWYKHNFAIPGSSPAMVRRGPSPFNRDKYIGVRDEYGRLYIQEKPLAPVITLVRTVDIELEETG